MQDLLPKPDIACWGASTRWAAELLQTHANLTSFDLFADQDTRSFSNNAFQLKQLKNIHTNAHLKALPKNTIWLPLGGTENLADEVAHLRTCWRVAMSPSTALESAKDPEILKRLLGDHFPRFKWKLAPERPALPAQEKWIEKPLVSAGGLRVRHVAQFRQEHSNPSKVDVQTGANPHSPTGNENPSSRRSTYYQQFVPGPSFSAIFLSTGDNSPISNSQTTIGQSRFAKTVLVGVTRQLVGLDFSHLPFGYAGSIGPFNCSTQVNNQLSDLGSLLSNALKATGLWGFDFILPSRTKSNEPDVQVVDINLRPTASTEIVQKYVDVNLLLCHLAAFVPSLWKNVMAGARQGKLKKLCPITEPGDLVPLFHAKSDTEKVSGKLIVFNDDHVLTWPGPASEIFTRWQNELGNTPGSSSELRIADFPAPGSQLEPFAPICTLLSSDDSEPEVERQLKHGKQELLKLLREHSSQAPQPTTP